MTETDTMPNREQWFREWVKGNPEQCQGRSPTAIALRVRLDIPADEMQADPVETALLLEKALHAEGYHPQEVWVR